VGTVSLDAGIGMVNSAGVPELPVSPQ
jgi:hypothetical protein